jgi:hypothetical protein
MNGIRCVEEPGDFVLLGRKVIDNGNLVEINDPEWIRKAKEFLQEMGDVEVALKSMFDQATIPIQEQEAKTP